MMARQRFAFDRLWENHERLYRCVFVEALALLANEPSVSGDERAISKRLHVLLCRVCRRISRESDTYREIPVPTADGLIPPTTIEDTSEEFTDKRPDFNCACANPFAESDSEYSVPLHVECKRLGASSGLSRQYVANGVQRFDLKSHRYGYRAPSGMMVGYVVGMSPAEIADEVNDHVRRRLPYVGMLDFTAEKALHKACHTFERREVVPATFTLFHLWSDLRGNYGMN